MPNPWLAISLEDYGKGEVNPAWRNRHIQLQPQNALLTFDRIWKEGLRTLA
jgi:hypothetical protein